MKKDKEKFEWIVIPGENGRRPRAKTDFGSVHKGDIGGLFDIDSSLSQVNDCWVFEDCVVRDGTKIIGDSIVKGASRVCGSIVGGQSVIQNQSMINFSFVSDSTVSNSVVTNSEVFDHAEITGSSIKNSKIFKTKELDTGPKNNSSIVTNSRLIFCELKGENNAIYSSALNNTTAVSLVTINNSVTKSTGKESYSGGETLCSPSQDPGEIVFSGRCKISDSKFKGYDIVIRNNSIMESSRVLGNNVEISNSHISRNVSIKDNITILNSHFDSDNDEGFSVGIRRSLPPYKQIMFNNALVKSENDFFIFEVSPDTFTTICRTEDVENFLVCNKGKTFFDYGEVRKYLFARFNIELDEKFKKKYGASFLYRFLFESIFDVEENIKKQIQKIETETESVFTHEEECRLTAIIFLNMSELAGKSINYLFSPKKHRWYKGGPNKTYSAIKRFCSPIPFDIKNKEQIETIPVYLTEETIRHLKKTSKNSDTLFKSECFLVLR